MKAVITCILIILLFSGCTQDNNDLKVSISKEEYKLMRKYVRKHKDILKTVNLYKDRITSSDKELLEKIKIRMAGIFNNKFLVMEKHLIIPIIINYQDKYFYVGLSEDDDWLNDEEIYKNLSPYKGYFVNPKIPDEIKNLNKNEFIEKYFFQDENGELRWKIKHDRNILVIEQDNNLYDSIILLCVTKYNLLVVLKYGIIYISEIEIKPR
jgi:hypothetical protein